MGRKKDAVSIPFDERRIQEFISGLQTILSELATDGHIKAIFDRLRNALERLYHESLPLNKQMNLFKDFFIEFQEIRLIYEKESELEMAVLRLFVELCVAFVFETPARTCSLPLYKHIRSWLDKIGETIYWIPTLFIEKLSRRIKALNALVRRRIGEHNETGENGISRVDISSSIFDSRNMVEGLISMFHAHSTAFYCDDLDLILDIHTLMLNSMLLAKHIFIHGETAIGETNDVEHLMMYSIRLLKSKMDDGIFNFGSDRRMKAIYIELAHTTFYLIHPNETYESESGNLDPMLSMSRYVSLCCAFTLTTYRYLELDMTECLFKYVFETYHKESADFVTYYIEKESGTVIDTRKVNDIREMQYPIDTLRDLFENGYRDGRLLTSLYLLDSVVSEFPSNLLIGRDLVFPFIIPYLLQLFQDEAIITIGDILLAFEIFRHICRVIGAFLEENKEKIKRFRSAEASLEGDEDSDDQTTVRTRVASSEYELEHLLSQSKAFLRSVHEIVERIMGRFQVTTKILPILSEIFELNQMFKEIEESGGKDGEMDDYLVRFMIRVMDRDLGINQKFPYICLVIPAVSSDALARILPRILDVFFPANLLNADRIGQSANRTLQSLLEVLKVTEKGRDLINNMLIPRFAENLRAASDNVFYDSFLLIPSLIQNLEREHALRLYSLMKGSIWAIHVLSSSRKTGILSWKDMIVDLDAYDLIAKALISNMALPTRYALDLICLYPVRSSHGSSRHYNGVYVGEIQLFRYFLRYRYRSLSPQLRQGFSEYHCVAFIRRALQHLSNRREPQSQDHSSSASERVEVVDNNARFETKEGLRSFLAEFLEFLMVNMYPSAPYQLMDVTIRIISKLFEVSSKRSAREFNLRILASRDAEQAYLGMLMGGWDHIREMVSSIFESIEDSSVEDEKHVKKLISSCRALINSVRLKESDAGGRLYVLLINRAIRARKGGKLTEQDHRGFLLYSEGISAEIVHPAAGLADGEPYHFIHLIVTAIIRRVRATVSAMENDPSSLVCDPFHGKLLFIHHILKDKNISSYLLAKPHLLDFTLVQVVSQLQKVIEAVTPLLVGGDMLDDVEIADEKMTYMFNAGSPVPVNEREAAKQKLRVCGWLAVKEASNLSTLLIERYSDYIPQMRVVTALGQPLFDFLLKAQHRGSLDKASIGLEAVCKHLASCNQKELYLAPMGWMNELLDRIMGRKEGFGGTTLRRSAGLPYLFVAISKSKMLLLSGEESRELQKDCLQIGVSELVSLLANGEQVAQSKERAIHALNILKAIVEDSYLKARLPIQNVEDFVKAAINLLDFPIYEVQNAALMLFSSLVKAYVSQSREHDMNSSGESSLVVKATRTTSSEFFLKYRGLLPFFIRKMLLNEDAMSDGNCQYYISVLISRLCPESTHNSILPELSPVQHQVNESIDLLVPLVSGRGLKSKEYTIRQLCATSLIPLLPATEGKLERYIREQLLDRISIFENMRNNAKHGILLQLKALISFSWAEIKPLPALLEDIFANLIGILTPSKSGSYPVMAVAFSILSMFVNDREAAARVELALSAESLLQFVVDLLDFKRESVAGCPFAPHSLPLTGITAFLMACSEFGINLVYYICTRSSATDLVTKAVTLTFNHSYKEVREAAISTSTRRFLQNRSGEHSSNEFIGKVVSSEHFVNSLYRTSVACLKTEKEENCLAQIMILIALSVPFAGEDIIRDSDFSSLNQLLFELRSEKTTKSTVISTRIRQSGTIEAAVLLASTILYRYSLVNVDLNSIGMVDLHWIEKLDEMTSPGYLDRLLPCLSIPYLLRLIMLSRCSKSGVIGAFSKQIVERTSIKVWIYTIRLLLDDDESIRKITSSYVSILLNDEEMDDGALLVMFCDLIRRSNPLGLNLSSSSVQIAGEESFNETFLVMKCFDYIEKAYEADDIGDLVLFSVFPKLANYNAYMNALSNEKVFLHEKDNFFIEEVLLAHIAHETGKKMNGGQILRLRTIPDAYPKIILKYLLIILDTLTREKESEESFVSLLPLSYSHDFFTFIYLTVLSCTYIFTSDGKDVARANEAIAILWEIRKGHEHALHYMIVEVIDLAVSRIEGKSNEVKISTLIV